MISGQPKNLQPATARPVVVTMGDPAGIGPDLVLQLWQQRQEYGLPPFLVIACPKMLGERIAMNGLDIQLQAITDAAQCLPVFGKALPVLPITVPNRVRPGIADSGNAQAIIGSIEQAVALVQSGQASAVVTNPINKEVLYGAGFRFPGHTEFLASLATLPGQPPVFPVMMLASAALNVVPVTIHIALSQVSETLTQELLIQNCHITSDALKHYFGIASPRLAIAGMNPHAGEGGAMGTEELDIIIPAIKKNAGWGACGDRPTPCRYPVS